MKIQKLFKVLTFLASSIVVISFTLQAQAALPALNTHGQGLVKACQQMRGNVNGCVKKWCEEKWCKTHSSKCSINVGVCMKNHGIK
jgi:hypothetical protein